MVLSLQEHIRQDNVCRGAFFFVCFVFLSFISQTSFIQEQTCRRRSQNNKRAILTVAGGWALLSSLWFGLRLQTQLSQLAPFYYWLFSAPFSKFWVKPWLGWCLWQTFHEQNCILFFNIFYFFYFFNSILISTDTVTFKSGCSTGVATT